MKLYALLTLATLSLPAFAQVCEVDLIQVASGRIIRTFSAYGDQSSCMEGMKECRKAIRFDYSNYPASSLDCVRPGNTQPLPTPVPVPQPQPIPGNVPYDVLRMTDIEQAANFALEGCHVKTGVDGWANQLFVRGQFKGNFQMGAQDMQLVRTIRDNQRQGQCLLKSGLELSIQFRPSLIQEAVDRELSSNCHVLAGVDGWANQLFVKQVHAGNFDMRSSTEQARLRGSIAEKIMSGVCQQRNSYEIGLMRSPRLVQDFANFQYRNCHVALNVQGWANQLFIGNQFKGNYDARTEVQKLKSDLVNLVVNGTCNYDPM